MSAAAPPQPPAPAHHAPRAPAGERCPLCGASLHHEQDWCLGCGAAARTRLASAPNWRLPVTTVAVVAVLSLGVLAAALVKLAGGSGSSANTTVLRTTPAASLLPSRPPTPSTAPTATTPAPRGSSSAASPPPAASTPRTTSTGARSGLGLGLPGGRGRSTAPVPPAGSVRRSLEEELRRLHNRK